MFVEIPGTNGFYSVDENGNVRSNDRIIFNKGSQKYNKIQGKPIKPCANNMGYFYVDLMIDKRRSRQLVHRLVAKTFIPNPDNLPCINHKDCNPANNSVDNLEWCDHSYNNKYAFDHGNRRVTEKMMKAFTAPKPHFWKSVICFSIETGEVIKKYDSITEAADDIVAMKSLSNIKACRTNISGCAHGRAKSSYGFGWKFVE